MACVRHMRVWVVTSSLSIPTVGSAQSLGLTSAGQVGASTSMHPQQPLIWDRETQAVDSAPHALHTAVLTHPPACL